MTTNADENATRPAVPPGIPGRLFVVPFILVLLVLGFLMFSVGARFQTIMGRLEQVRSLWPRASQKLKVRYDAYAEAVDASRPSDETNVSELREKFDATSLFDTQSVASMVFEDHIANKVGKDWRSSDFQEADVAKLIETDRQRSIDQHGFIGWLTVNGLRLKLPPVYDPIATAR